MSSRRRVLAVLVAAVAVLGACGDEADSTAEAERQVFAALAGRFEEPDDVEVTCPDDLVLEAGSSLACELVIGDATPQRAEFDVNEDGILVLANAVIPTTDAEAFLVTQLEPSAEGPVAVDCGEEPLIVGVVGDTFMCAATRTADGVEFPVMVDIAGLDGVVRLQHYVVPTTAVPATEPPP